MTAAAVRTWAAVSLTVASRSRSSALTPCRPFRTFGSGCDGFDEVERQALRLCQERVHVEPSRA